MNGRGARTYSCSRCSPSTGASYASPARWSARLVGGHEQPHAQALAAPVRLQDDGLAGEVALRGGDDMLASGNQDGARRGDAVALQCCVLAGLADLEVERARTVDHAPVPAREPGQHRGGEFRRKAMVARVRRGAHAVVEHALRRRGGEIEGAGVEEPFGPGQSALVEGLGERRQPGGILVQDMDAAHAGISRGMSTMEEDFSSECKWNALWRMSIYIDGYCRILWRRWAPPWMLSTACCRGLSPLL